MTALKDNQILWVKEKKRKERNNSIFREPSSILYTNYSTYQKDGVFYNLDQGFSAEKFSDGVYYFVFYYTGFTKTFEYSGSITVLRSK